MLFYDPDCLRITLQDYINIHSDTAQVRNLDKRNKLKCAQANIIW